MRSFGFIWVSIIYALISAFMFGCGSVPNLETTECIGARDTVKRFYSYHFGNDMHPSPENARARQEYLTPELLSSLLTSKEEASDYFTATTNYPKAFRVGGCNSHGADHATFQVLFFWRDDTASEQKEVRVETVRKNGTWLIDKVSG